MDDSPPLTIRAAPETLEITIPLRRLESVIRVVQAASLVWAGGEVLAIRELLSGSSGPATAAALAWTGLALWLFSAWGWLRQATAQIVSLRPRDISITTANQTVGYDLARASNLRVVPPDEARGPRADTAGTWLIRRWGPPRVAFDHGPVPKRAVYFAYGIDDGAAAQIVGELQARHPFPA